MPARADVERSLNRMFTKAFSTHVAPPASKAMRWRWSIGWTESAHQNPVMKYDRDSVAMCRWHHLEGVQSGLCERESACDGEQRLDRRGAVRRHGSELFRRRSAVSDRYRLTAGFDCRCHGGDDIAVPVPVLLPTAGLCPVGSASGESKLLLSKGFTVSQPILNSRCVWRVTGCGSVKLIAELLCKGVKAA